MKHFIFLSMAAVFLLFSCRKQGCDPGKMTPMLTIHYTDSSGKDLFTNGFNGYWKDSTTVKDYYGDTSSVYGGFFPVYGGNRMIVSYNTDIVNNYGATLIHLKPGVDDTLKTHVAGNSSMSPRYDSIWYNSQPESVKDSVIVITK